MPRPGKACRIAATVTLVTPIAISAAVIEALRERSLPKATNVKPHSTINTFSTHSQHILNTTRHTAVPQKGTPMTTSLEHIVANSILLLVDIVPLGSKCLHHSYHKTVLSLHLAVCCWSSNIQQAS